MGFSLGKTLSGAVSGFVSSGGSPWGAAIGAGSGFLDAYQDKAAYNYARNKDIQLWNMQNSYNSPKEQMQRYRDANLNPNLIYSQSNTADAVGHSAMDTSSDTLGSANNLANGKMQRMAQYQGILTNQATVEEINARTESIHNQIKNANELLPYQKEALMAQIKNTQANTQNSIVSMNSPSWLSKFIGRENSEQFMNFLTDLIK